MIQFKEKFSIIGVNDIDEPVLMLIGFLNDQPPVEQFLVWAGKIRNVDLQMVPIKFRNLLFGSFMDRFRLGRRTFIIRDAP